MSKLGSWLKGEITPEEKEILLELKNNLTFFPKKRISDDDGFNLELRDGKVVGLKLSGFKAIPRAIYKLKNLEWIELVENNRIYPPLEEDLLPNLIDLKISSNPIKKLSVTFGNFRSLEVLDLSNNKLETLPDIFHQLKNLKKVILRNNQLNDLPESFEQLHQLNELDLSYNRFHVSLPSSLRKLNKLEHVKIDNNFFGDVPPDKVLYTLFLGCDWWLEKHPPNKPY
ncbi:MAG: leucine-rich repeat domain-containing protein, partial [Promethearchaeota archaeon]